LPVYITQQIERNEQLRLQERGRRERINRYSHDIETRVLDFMRLIPKVRQLAETKWSPIATIEDQDHRANGHQLVEPPDLAAGVGERKVRRHLSNSWYAWTS